MAGHNHDPWCTCGWCIGGQSTGQPSSYSYRWDYNEISRIHSYASFVTPNARCPVCDERVFFYQSPYGGKVFFDALGPPWPKHPCTTKDKALLPIPTKNLYPTQNLLWEKNGWEPYICKSIYRNPKYQKITLINDQNEITKVINNINIVIKESTLVHLRKMNSNLYEASMLMNNNEPLNILLASLLPTKEESKTLETTIMESYSSKKTKSSYSNEKIDKSYYEMLAKDPSTPIVILSYIFFRFFDDTSFTNSIIEHPISKKTKMNGIFSDIIEYGIKRFMDYFYKEYKSYDIEHIEIFKKIENAPLTNGIKKIIEKKEKSFKSADIESSFSRKGWAIK